MHTCHATTHTIQALVLTYVEAALSRIILATGCQCVVALCGRSQIFLTAIAKDWLCAEKQKKVPRTIEKIPDSCCQRLALCREKATPDNYCRRLALSQSNSPFPGRISLKQTNLVIVLMWLFLYMEHVSSDCKQLLRNKKKGRRFCKQSPNECNVEEL